MMGNQEQFQVKSEFPLTSEESTRFFCLREWKSSITVGSV